jgi:hypothetical protein
MEQLYIKEPTMYKGVLSWSDAVLAVNIKHVNSSYDPTDPRTWPLINLLNANKDRPYQFPNIIPSFVAYKGIGGCDQNEVFLPWHKWAQHATDKTRRLDWHFRHLPYNFTMAGYPRHYIGTPWEDFLVWMGFVYGKDWDMPAKTVKTNVVEPAPGKACNVQNTAYEKIMDALKTTTGDLRERDRAEGLQRACNESDQRVIDVIAYNKEMKDSICRLHTRRDKEEEQANIADNKIKILEEGLEKQRAATSDAQAEAKASKEQIEKIWEVMNGGSDKGKGKRRADHEDVAEQMKKAKTGHGVNE